MKKNGYVYILTNDYNSVLYVGVTSNLLKRIYQHKNHEVSGFSSKYNLHKLVYFEEFDLVTDALQREKRIKNGIENGRLILLIH